MALEITASLLEEAMSLPSPLRRSGRDVEALPNARPAGVLVPVRLGPDPHVIAMVRSRKMRDHAGEVGFPGGKNEPGETLQATALREAEEEIGLGKREVKTLGRLESVSVITGRFVIHPFVGLVETASPIVPCPGEVERVLELPIVPWLSGELSMGAVEMDLGDERLQLPHFPLGEAVLYGASAYVFHELLVRIATVLGRPLPPPRLQDELPWRGRYGV